MDTPTVGFDPVTRQRLAIVERHGDSVDGESEKRRIVTRFLVHRRANLVRSLAGSPRKTIVEALRYYGIRNMGIAHRLSVGRPLTPTQVYSLLNDPVPHEHVDEWLAKSPDRALAVSYPTPA